MREGGRDLVPDAAGVCGSIAGAGCSAGCVGLAVFGAEEDVGDGLAYGGGDAILEVSY